MATESWWVGALIEEGMSTGSSATPYMPFVFQAASKADAQKGAEAKLLAGPFTTQAKAQAWANSYEKNPATLHAGSGLSPSTGTVKGDTAPNPDAAIGKLFSLQASSSLVLRITEGVLGVVLIAVGLARLTHASSAVSAVTKVAEAVK